MYEFNLIEFQKFREIILQHPHKRRMNNRSVPLIKLCVRGSGGGGGKKWGGDTGGAEKYGNEIAKGYDFNLLTVISRRLEDKVTPRIVRLINNLRGNQIRVFPSEGSV